MLCSLCVCNGVAVRSNQDLITENLLPGRELLLQTNLINYVTRSVPEPLSSAPASGLLGTVAVPSCRSRPRMRTCRSQLSTSVPAPALVLLGSVLASCVFSPSVCLFPLQSASWCLSVSPSSPFPPHPSLMLFLPQHPPQHLCGPSRGLHAVWQMVL